MMKAVIPRGTVWWRDGVRISGACDYHRVASDSHPALPPPTLKPVALFGHPTRTHECPLPGVKRTYATRPLCRLMIHSRRTRSSCHREARERYGEKKTFLTRINAKCVSYFATSHHIAGASTARRTIGIHMNQAAPAYSPLTTL